MSSCGIVARLRRGGVATAGGLLLIAGCAPAAGKDGSAAPAPVSITSDTASPTSAAPSSPATSARATIRPPQPEVRTAVVPRLVGLPSQRARAALARTGLQSRIASETTSGAPAGTVLSQSVAAGTGVRRATVVTLVIAKAPPTPPPAPSPTAAPRGCDPSYPDDCLRTGIGDYDCAAGSGNGPNYVNGPIRVRPPDPFDLDRDGDGIGCEQG